MAIDISDNPNLNRDGQPDHRNMDFGSRLRYYRTARGLTQQELAKMVGLTSVTISKYERRVNMPKNSKIIADLSKALGIFPHDFLEKSHLHIQRVKLAEDDEPSYIDTTASNPEDCYIWFSVPRKNPDAVKI